MKTLHNPSSLLRFFFLFRTNAKAKESKKEKSRKKKKKKSGKKNFCALVVIMQLRMAPVCKMVLTVSSFFVVLFADFACLFVCPLGCFLWLPLFMARPGGMKKELKQGLG
ncbi:hypothetical protein F5H01DRAFT_135594 [Linnemannia elongata]|nr:hypothetical protein F5H01DRAFT_135594 [Linnemannia elongata]